MANLLTAKSSGFDFTDFHRNVRSKSYNPLKTSDQGRCNIGKENATPPILDYTVEFLLKVNSDVLFLFIGVWHIHNFQSKIDCMRYNRIDLKLVCQLGILKWELNFSNFTFLQSYANVFYAMNSIR